MSAEPLPQPEALDGVLAPEQTAEVFGHSGVRGKLLRQIAAERLPGAVLLHGPRGIGKATLAFDFARELFSRTGDEDPARVSEQIAQGVYPNLFVLRRTLRDSSNFYTQIRVEDVRDLQHRLRQTRGRAGYRICVIDSADDCNKSAANALLKILEEPPAETLFAVISHRPGGLLPTIRSRCQAYAMRGISNADVRPAVLAQMPELATEELERAIGLAAGRPRRAIEALMLEKGAVLESLKSWLADPLAAPRGTQLTLADAIAGSGEAETGFARDMISDALAQEARDAAQFGPPQRLASAAQLWEKAQSAIAEADIYNLDQRQLLISIFDALLAHFARHAYRSAG